MAVAKFIVEIIFAVFGLGVVLFVCFALVAPFEAMGWWAGWSRRTAESDPLAPSKPPRISHSDAAAVNYVVYLTAIGNVSCLDISGRETRFLQLLAKCLPDAVIVSDVFPFSVNNIPLNGDRRLARIWQWIHQVRIRNRRNLLGWLIFLRNTWQVAVSADSRYGPLYNVGIAKEIIGSLKRHGFPASGQARITLIAWSGGAQIAIGAARYVYKALQAPIRVVSVAGVIGDNPGIDYIEHLFHLNGSRDPVPKIGLVLSPGRWPIFGNSAWNRAKRDGRITVIETGPMRHTGLEDYFDRCALLPSGQSFLDRTVEIIADVILGGMEQRSAAATPVVTLET